MNQLLSRMLFGVGALLLVLIVTARSDNEYVPREFSEAAGRGMELARPIVDGMGSGVREERESAYIGWGTANSSVITTLLSIAKTKKEHYDITSDSRALAVEMLGRMRVREAIPILLDDLDWHKQALSVLESSPFNSYPCAAALHEMGVEVVPRMLRHVTNGLRVPASDKKIELVAHMLLEFYDGQEAGARESEFVVRRFAERNKLDLQRLESKIRDLRKNWTANKDNP